MAQAVYASYLVVCKEHDFVTWPLLPFLALTGKQICLSVRYLEQKCQMASNLLGLARKFACRCCLVLLGTCQRENKRTACAVQVRLPATNSPTRWPQHSSTFQDVPSVLFLRSLLRPQNGLSVRLRCEARRLFAPLVTLESFQLKVVSNWKPSVRRINTNATELWDKVLKPPNLHCAGS